jgi:hypothetical protein
LDNQEKAKEMGGNQESIIKHFSKVSIGGVAPKKG